MQVVPATRMTLTAIAKASPRSSNASGITDDMIMPVSIKPISINRTGSVPRWK